MVLYKNILTKLYSECQHKTWYFILDSFKNLIKIQEKTNYM